MSVVNYSEDPIVEDVIGVEKRDSAEQSKVREIHLGFVNLMPDSAYFQTIRQWVELVNESETSVQIYIHLIHLEGTEREDSEVLEHIYKYSKSVEEALREGLDGIIVSGGNREISNLLDLPFIEDFKKIVDAVENGDVTSGLFACLAEHIRVKLKYGIDRTLNAKKNISIARHQVPVSSQNHFLKRGLDTSFDAVHARRGDLVPQDLEGTDMIPLDFAVEAPHSIGAMVDSKFKFLGIQTHAEYTAIGFLQEYLRDLELFHKGEELELPFPNCFTPEGELLVKNFIESPERVADKDSRKDLYKELTKRGLINTTWKGAGNALVHRWISGVLKITGYGRHEKYDKRVDPNDPHAYLVK